MRNTQDEKPVRRLLLTRADLKALGIWQSNSTLLRLEAAGRFPRRLRLAGASVCWDHDEVMSWIEARKAERAGWHYADAS
jgi:Predicted transcriptional regulator